MYIYEIQWLNEDGEVMDDFTEWIARPDLPEALRLLGSRLYQSPKKTPALAHGVFFKLVADPIKFPGLQED